MTTRQGPGCHGYLDVNRKPGDTFNDGGGDHCHWTFSFLSFFYSLSACPDQTTIFLSTIPLPVFPAVPSRPRIDNARDRTFFPQIFSARRRKTGAAFPDESLKKRCGADFLRRSRRVFMRERSWGSGTDKTGKKTTYLERDER